MQCRKKIEDCTICHEIVYDSVLDYKDSLWLYTSIVTHYDEYYDDNNICQTELDYIETKTDEDHSYDPDEDFDSSYCYGSSSAEDLFDCKDIHLSTCSRALKIDPKYKDVARDSSYICDSIYRFNATRREIDSIKSLDYPPDVSYDFNEKNNPNCGGRGCDKPGITKFLNKDYENYKDYDGCFCEDLEPEAYCEKDKDSDCDGVNDDGKGDGTIYSPCINGQYEGCDDNCVDVINPDQENSDNDSLGNACDDDDDNDDINDIIDKCPKDKCPKDKCPKDKCFGLLCTDTLSDHFGCPDEGYTPSEMTLILSFEYQAEKLNSSAMFISFPDGVSSYEDDYRTIKITFNLFDDDNLLPAALKDKKISLTVTDVYGMLDASGSISYMLDKSDNLYSITDTAVLVLNSIGTAGTEEKLTLEFNAFVDSINSTIASETYQIEQTSADSCVQASINEGGDVKSYEECSEQYPFEISILEIEPTVFTPKSLKIPNLEITYEVKPSSTEKLVVIEIYTNNYELIHISDTLLCGDNEKYVWDGNPSFTEYLDEYEDNYIEQQDSEFRVILNITKLDFTVSDTNSFQVLTYSSWKEDSTSNYYSFEMDCDDWAKLCWYRYCQSNQTNATWIGGSWTIATPADPQGLPNVNNNNYYHSGLGGADDLCTVRMEDVNDRDNDNILALDGYEINYADLRPGDVIFFDWTLDGNAEHTLVIDGINNNNAVGSYGNYNNLDEDSTVGNNDGILDWNEIDLQSITIVNDVESYLDYQYPDLTKRRDYILAVKKFKGEQ